MTAAPPDGPMLRESFGHFPSGIVAVCATARAGPVGMAVSTFTPVSLDPPLVGICVRRSSRTWPVLRGRPRLGLTVLAEVHGAAARRLAARDGDRFADLEYRTLDTGAIRVDDGPVFFECALETEHPAGDHTLAVLRVHRVETEGTSRPLVFHRSGFGRLMSGGLHV